MLRAMKRALLAVLLLANAVAAHAQARSQDYIRDLVELAGILGGAHAIRVACNGRGDQYWRERMSGLLELEAPEASPLRRSMVDAFNRTYGFESERRLVCDSSARDGEIAYAAQGRMIADRMAARLLPKRAASQSLRQRQ